MKIIIKRQLDQESKPYWESFDYEGEGRETVAHILDQLNYKDDLMNDQGEASRRVRWECSCMQKMCGGCAMVINGDPALACSTFIDTKKQKKLKLEPLSKFPVITDLRVDRTCIAEYQKEAMMYLGSLGDVKKTSEKEYDRQYTVAKCLKCGLCLEVCPNYMGITKGETVRDVKDVKFYGAATANQAYLYYSTTGDRQSEIKEQYQKHFARSCSKSLACRDICPMKIPTLSSIGFMNKVK